MNKLKEHNVVPRVLSILMAVVLWLYVLSVDNPPVVGTYNKIGVQIEGINQLEKNDLVIVDGAQTTISVKLTGNRDLISEVDGDKIKATIAAASLSAITAPGTYYVNYDISLNVPEGVQISTKSPSQITLTVDRIISASVPVKLENKGKLPDGYYLKGYTLTPDAVTVKGPERDVNQVSYAYVTYDLSQITSSADTSLNYTLMNKKDEAVNMSRLTVEESSVLLKTEITRQMSVPLSVNITPSDYITSDMVTYTVEPSSIQITGLPETMSTLNHIDLGTISIKTLLEQDITEVTLPIQLPNGVLAENVPASAKITFSFKGLVRSPLTVSSSSFAPSSAFTYDDKSISLTLFGRAEELAKLTEAKVTITPIYSADSLTPGTHVLPVGITIDPTVKVSVIGKYTVTITVPELPGNGGGTGVNPVGTTGTP